MEKDTRTDLQTTEKPTVTRVPEHTRSGPVYAPPVDIFENDSSITVLADMPGVKAPDVKIDLRENVLTLTGHATSPEGPKEAEVLREYHAHEGTYVRQFTLSEAIDQAKIDARLTDGVLRLTLPKVDKARPREIRVKAG